MCAFLLLASVIKTLKPVQATTSSYLPVAIKNTCLSLDFSVSYSTPVHHSCNARVVQWKVYLSLPNREQPSVVSLIIEFGTWVVQFRDINSCVCTA